MQPSSSYLAAKFRSAHEGEADFHPLICHMLDVAAVAERMWDEVLPPAICRRIHREFALDENGTRAWVAFLAGLHDIGKASPAFQVRK